MCQQNAKNTRSAVGAAEHVLFAGCVIVTRYAPTLYHIQRKMQRLFNHIFQKGSRIVSQKNVIPRDYKDVFKAFLIKDTQFVGDWDMPMVRTSEWVPEKLIPFDKFNPERDHERWVHFFIDDFRFERIWNRPQFYLEKLKQCRGVLSTDFSLYTNMKLPHQMWNAYRNRLLASWFQQNGIEVIPKVRWGNAKSYLFCFDGIEPGKTVAIGTHGCIKKKQDKYDFQKGLEAMLERLYPKTIVIYGKAPEKLFAPCIQNGIQLIQFDSQFHLSRQKAGG